MQGAGTAAGVPQAVPFLNPNSSLFEVLLTARCKVWNCVFNVQPPKPVPPTGGALAQTRSRFVGLRLREDDAASLERLAEVEGVGISTFARMVLEQYVALYGRPKRR